jgi:hypothetical protein
VEFNEPIKKDDRPAAGVFLNEVGVVLVICFLLAYNLKIVPTNGRQNPMAEEISRILLTYRNPANSDKMHTQSTL